MQLKFKYLEDIFKHRPAFNEKFRSTIEKFNVEASLTRLVELFGIDEVRESVQTVIKKMPDCEPYDLINHLVVLHTDYSLASPFEIGGSCSVKGYSFTRVTSYREFFELGQLFRNCLFGIERFDCEVRKQVLFQVSCDDEAVGLISMSESRDGIWTVYDCLSRKNKPASNREEVRNTLMLFLRARGCAVSDRQEHDPNRILRDIRRTSFRYQ